MVNHCKKCKGEIFTQEGLTNKQITARSWKCTHCGTIAKSSITKGIQKKRKKQNKASISVTIQYQPVSLTCESCGGTFGRMGAPQDFKRRAKNEWKNHDCEEKRKQDTMSYT